MCVGYFPLKKDVKTIWTPQISGAELKKELNKCNVMYDLPKDNDVRASLVQVKLAMEETVQSFLVLTFHRL